MYSILEAKIRFKTDNTLEMVTVLVHMSGNDFRVISAGTTPMSGYYFILPGTICTYELFQRVAGQGFETHDIDKQFPGWRKKYYKKIK